MSAEIVPFRRPPHPADHELARLMTMRSRALAHIVNLVALLKDTNDMLPAESRRRLRAP